MPSDIAVLTVLRMLRTGNSCQQLHDQAGFSKATIAVKFKMAIEAIVSRWGPIFMPDEPDSVVESEILQSMGDRGFIGCAGSFDCTHVTWKCPKRAQPLFKGKENDTTVVAQCIAGPNLYCTHCFVGSAGTNNDLTTLRLDGFVHRILNGLTGSHTFTLAGETFHRKYYLADGIYPSWSIFATTIASPVTVGEQRYAKRQESCRKDVERLFGVVKQRFKIIRKGNRVNFSEKSVLCDIIRACFILHNIVVLHSSGGMKCVRDMESRHAPSGIRAVDSPTSVGAQSAPGVGLDIHHDNSDLLLEFGCGDGSFDATTTAVSAKERMIRLMTDATMDVINSAEHFRLKNALIRVHSSVAQG